MRTCLLHATRCAVLSLSCLLLASVSYAQTETTLESTAPPPHNYKYKVEYLGAVYDEGNTTFSYRVTEEEGKSLSNFMIELCIDDEDDIISISPSAEVHINSTDGTYGLYGIKWNLAESFSSGVFTFTLSGNYVIAPVAVGAKGGPPYITATINGPSCDLCTPDDKPFWDGNFTGGDPVPGEGYFQIQTAQGFERIELTVHDNIAIAGLALADGTVVSDVDLSGPHGTGWRVMEYTGSDVLTDVRILVRALTQGGSQFMFQVEDGCGFSAQLDPVVQLDAPSAISLAQNYPNPFNPQTSIRFQLPEASNVRLVVYDVLGRQVKSLLSGELGAGDHEAVWDGTDGSGLRVPSGVYLYRLEAGDFVQIRQMTMLK